MTTTRTLSKWLCVLALLIGGCMSERSSQIPADAMIPAEGDKQLQFTANRPGMVYVYDRNNDQLIYSGSMDRGQMLTVDPMKDCITIDGRTVHEKNLNNGDTRRIFFKGMTGSGMNGSSMQPMNDGR